MRRTRLTMYAAALAISVFAVTQARAQIPDIGGAIDGAIDGATDLDVDLGDTPRLDVDADIRNRTDLDARSNMRWHNGYWWHQRNDGNWLYFRDGQWYNSDGSLFGRSRGGVDLDANLDLDDAVRGRIDADLDTRTRGDFDGQSRMRWHNGYWWHQRDDGSWLYYRDGQWYNTDGSLFNRSRTGNDLDADVDVGDAVRGRVDADLDTRTRTDVDGGSRMRWHNGYWWYPTDDGGWIYYDNGSWFNTDGRIFSRGNVRGDMRLDVDDQFRGRSDLDLRGRSRGGINLRGGPRGILPR